MFIIFIAEKVSVIVISETSLRFFFQLSISQHLPISLPLASAIEETRNLGRPRKSRGIHFILFARNLSGLLYFG